MGGEDMANSGFSMEEDVVVELDSGFRTEADSELSLAGKVNVGFNQCPELEELDWFLIARHEDSRSESREQREGSSGGDGGSQTQEEGEMEAESESKEGRNGGTDDETEDFKKEETEGTFDVRLWPAEENRGHVRISLEEVERYYRFSRCCHWLLGRCLMC